MDYLDTLSGFAAAFNPEQLDEAQREQLGWILADTLAAMAAGSAEPEVRALVQRQPRAEGASGAVMLGLGRRTHREAAAFINGTAGTFLEMDEGNRFSRGHPAVHVIPAALALSEDRLRPAGDFLAAIVAGYEVGSRLGAASQLRGALHPHGTWGTIGAAAATARAAGLGAVSMREAISLSASMATATSKQTMLEGGLVRNTYAGLSNRNGLMAASQASAMGQPRFWARCCQTTLIHLRWWPVWGGTGTSCATTSSCTLAAATTTARSTLSTTWVRAKGSQRPTRSSGWRS